MEKASTTTKSTTTPHIPRVHGRFNCNHNPLQTRTTTIPRTESTPVHNTTSSGHAVLGKKPLRRLATTVVTDVVQVAGTLFSSDDDNDDDDGGEKEEEHIC
jgi:hypothetical protein